MQRGMGGKPTSVNWDGNLLICKDCKVPQSENQFGPDKREKYRNFKTQYCYSCSRLQGASKRIKTKNSFKYYLTNLLCTIRQRASGKYRKSYGCKNKDFDITIEDLKNLWEQQEGKCAISGLKMTHISLEGRQPTNCSVDRIDSSKGYIKGNIQLVCMIVNIMKSDLTKENLIYFCKEIVNNNK